MKRLLMLGICGFAFLGAEPLAGQFRKQPSELFQREAKPPKRVYAGWTMVGPSVGVSIMGERSYEFEIDASPLGAGTSVNKVMFFDKTKKEGAYSSIGLGCGYMQVPTWRGPTEHAAFTAGKLAVGIMDSHLFAELGASYQVGMIKNEPFAVPNPVVKFGLYF